jgi:hypothetical protein
MHRAHSREIIHHVRLVRVGAVQQAWFDAKQRTVEYCLAHGGLDALAITGYFGPTAAHYTAWEQLGKQLTASQVLSDLRESIDQNERNTRSYAALARAQGLRLLVYEGGQHIQPKGQQAADYIPALTAAQRDPGMYNLYQRQLAVSKEAGCSLFMAFSSVGRRGQHWGDWGHIEYYGQPLAEAPKLRALLDTNYPR